MTSAVPAMTIQPSRTLLRAAIRRAAHQVLDRPLILDDPLILRLVPEAAEPSVLATLDDPGAPDARRFRILFATRQRFAEDRLARAAARGVRQYVMLGAGLDTFPWRQPPFAGRMQLFAADLPASLEWTQARLRARGFAIPSNLAFVPVDVERKRLGEELSAGGFASGQACFCSALGLTQFLSADAIGAMLSFVAALPAGSEIVFSFVPPDDELDGDDLRGAVLSAARTRSLGEPWKTRLRQRDLVGRLAGLGFGEVFHLTPELARARYFADRTDVPGAPRWEQLMAAIV